MPSAISNDEGRMQCATTEGERRQCAATPISGRRWEKDEPPVLNAGFVRSLLLVVAVAGAMYLTLAASSVHFSRAESYFAESVREMIKGSNWITPLYHGSAFMDKPILQYWLILASFKSFGISHFAARVPTIIASLLTI